jgi:SsrA-binding protein
MKILQKNRKALFNYEVIDKYVAGISLIGAEVKSVLAGEISLSEGWVRVEGNNVWLKQVHIARYGNVDLANSKVDESRDRRLLLKKDEIKKIAKQSREKTIAIIPLDVHYSDTKKIKLSIAVCRGKKLHDKREDIKQRDLDRDSKRELKRL